MIMYTVLDVISFIDWRSIYSTVLKGVVAVGVVVPANASSHRANTSTMCANRRAAHIRRVVAADPSSLLEKNHRSSESAT